VNALQRDDDWQRHLIDDDEEIGRVIRETRRDKAQIGKLIRSLAGHGLLTQSPDPADARRQRLTLTAEGRAVARKSEAHRRAVARQLLRGMSRSERSVLIEMLAGIQCRLEHATKSTD